MNVEALLKTEKKIPRESRTIIHIMLINNKIIDAISQVLKPFEISIQQYNVLRILNGQQGKPANLSTLNQRMITKMSNTSRLVDKLIDKGYVDRKICSANRRKVEISITPSGIKDLKKMGIAVEHTEKEILKNFKPKDFKQLNTLFDKF